MAKNSIELHLSKDDKDVAYVSLPNHPGKGTHGVSINKYDLNTFIRITKGQIWFLTLTTQIV